MKLLWLEKVPCELDLYLIHKVTTNSLKVASKNPHSSHCFFHKQVHVEFVDSSNVIKIEGPPEEADKAKEVLEKQANDLKDNMEYVEISVDAKYHKHIIGKGGSTGKFFSFIHFPPPKNDDNPMRVVWMSWCLSRPLLIENTSWRSGWSREVLSRSTRCWRRPLSACVGENPRFKMIIWQSEKVFFVCKYVVKTM